VTTQLQLIIIIIIIIIFIIISSPLPNYLPALRSILQSAEMTTYSSGQLNGVERHL